MSRSVYQEHGHADRAAYLKSLEDEFALVPPETIAALAEVLGPTEDFDGLVVALEDAEGMDWDA